MRIAMIHCWYLQEPGQKVLMTCDKDNWMLWYCPWSYSLTWEGYNVDIFDPRELDATALNNYDVLVINVRPEMARAYSSIMPDLDKRMKVIAIESDPYGGIDGVYITDLSVMLDVYNSATLIVPLHKELASLYPDKILHLPFGVNTRYTEKFLSGDKFEQKTVVLLHTHKIYGGFLRTVELLLKHNYQVIGTVTLDEEQLTLLQHHIDNLFGINKVELLQYLPDSSHTELIAKSHLICSLGYIAVSGCAIPKAAAFGVPCVTLNNHFFQRIYYPDILPETIDEADNILGNQQLLDESAVKAKEIAYKLSTENPEYRKMIVDKFKEIAEL